MRRFSYLGLEEKMINWAKVRIKAAYTALLPTPIEPLQVTWCSDGLIAAQWGDVGLQLPRDIVMAAPVVEPPEWVYTIVDFAFRGVPLEQIPVVDSGLTSLEQHLLSWATEIPFGTLCSYGELARRAGFAGRARAAGHAMSLSPLAYIIPTHRVVRSNGRPTRDQQGGLNERCRRYESG